jgi:hypothetical protein
MWSTPVDLYCERLDPSFWAEPVNAVSNIAFMIAAVAALMHWRRYAGDLATLALIGLTFAIGFGSFTFHTLATRGAMLLDVGPIGVFIYGYFLLALRQMLGLSWSLSIASTAAFAVLSTGIASYVPREMLNGSTGYFPALAALLVFGSMLRDSLQGRAMLAAAGVFVVSVTLRIIDLDICPAFALGTHFLWHVLNAVVLYLLLRGAMVVRLRTRALAS